MGKVADHKEPVIGDWGDRVIDQTESLEIFTGL